MKDDQLDDLKQFIEATVSQSEQRVKTELKEEMSAVKTELKEEMANGFAGVGDAIEEIHNIIEKNQTEVDQRLTKLEPQTA